MATLVLTAVGTAIGGPIGGALGGMIGQAIDTQVFGPGPRRGPRLDDLRVQTSSYGTQIPRLYGRMRVAGTVVWATDFQESESIEGGGKGSPETVQYAYSCSFAVALSSRPIVGVGRIWADGKLIRGKDGDFKVKTRFRVHRGEEGQDADPLIASVEGASRTPAYRGLALAVFEDLALAEFGNRIPMLTFEVIADNGPLGATDIIRDASGGAVSGLGGFPIDGFAASGTDRRSAIESLADLCSTRFRVARDGIEALSLADPQEVATDEPSGWKDGPRAGPARGEWSQEAAASTPAGLTVQYHEPARDYQAGAMRATMPGGRGDMVLDSAAALTTTAAKLLAETALARRSAGRDRLTLRLSPDWINLVPGDQLDLGWRAGRWTVEEVLVEAFAVVVDCRRSAEAGGTFTGDPGRAVAQPDTPLGASVIALFDLPATDGVADGLCLHAAVSADGAFKAVPLTSILGLVEGPSVLAVRRARLGTTRTAMSPSPSEILDLGSSVDVALVDSSQILLNADDDALDAGANLCMAGDELFQFGRADDLGDGVFRLSRLVRGRRGSEWAAATGCPAGTPFVMVDRSALVPIAVERALLGQAIDVSAHGVVDDENSPPTAHGIFAGAGLAPLSPCHVSAAAGEEVAVRWVGRSRDRWSWNDGVDGTAIAARFELRAVGTASSVRIEVDQPWATLDAEQLATLGAGQVRVEVREQGSLRSSPPAILEFTN